MKLLNAWNKFFFEPISASTLALFRIAFGFVVFLSVLGRFPFRNIFYGEHGLVSLDTARHYFAPDWLYFLWVPETEPWLGIFFGVLLISTICLILGYKSRVASVITFLGIISLSNRNFFIDNAGDDLVRINLFFLMFAPSGAAYSIDRWLRVRKGLESADKTPMIVPWAQRILQMQLMYVYADTFYEKLPGPTWAAGTALYYAMGYLELRRFDFNWILYYLWELKLLTWSVMAAEVGLPLLIWFRKLRYWMLGAGIGLHIGINLMMQFPVFQYVMISSLLIFVYPEHVEAAVEWLAAKRKLLFTQQGPVH